MNIEIANRLVNLRKEMGLSQEQLAEKIGVSRQAVSKWERSEASPDTDNIILLARLYNISLDDLLRTEDDIPESNEAAEETADETVEEPEASGFEQTEAESADDGNVFEETFNENFEKNFEKNGDRVHIGLDGIHVEDSDGDVVHIGLGGIHVEERGGDRVHVGLGGIHVNDEHYKDFKDFHRNRCKFSIPIVMLSIIGFLAWGFSVPDGWNFSWLCLFAIPVLCSLESAILHKDPSHFAYPVFLAFIFCYLGVFYTLWHPAWTIFTTIPIYYIGCDLIKGKRKPALHAIYPILISMAYIIVGFCYNLWHPTWIAFLTIPIYYWVVNLIKKK